MGSYFFPPHAWLPLKELQHFPIPLSHKSSRDGQPTKYDPFLKLSGLSGTLSGK